LAKYILYDKILVVLERGMIMSKKVQKIAVWTMLIIMVFGTLIGFAAYFIAR
jgi:hypothetical protein